MLGGVASLSAGGRVLFLAAPAVMFVGQQMPELFPEGVPRGYGMKDGRTTADDSLTILVHPGRPKHVGELSVDVSCDSIEMLPV